MVFPCHRPKPIFTKRTSTRHGNSGCGFFGASGFGKNSRNGWLIIFGKVYDVRLSWTASGGVKDEFGMSRWSKGASHEHWNMCETCVNGVSVDLASYSFAPKIFLGSNPEVYVHDYAYIYTRTNEYVQNARGYLCKRIHKNSVCNYRLNMIKPIITETNAKLHTHLDRSTYSTQGRTTWRSTRGVKTFCWASWDAMPRWSLRPCATPRSPWNSRAARAVRPAVPWESLVDVGDVMGCLDGIDDLYLVICLFIFAFFFFLNIYIYININ